MADRQSTPKLRKKLAAKATIFALAAICAVPALAATSPRMPCSEAREATLDVPDNALITASVSHDTPIEEIEVSSSTSMLAPRAEAAIRDAFDESDSAATVPAEIELSIAVMIPPMAGTDSKTKPADENDEKSVSGMNTKLPGISDDAMLRYKKQMYRRDI
jgi:hypothetical protein